MGTNQPAGSFLTFFFFLRESARISQDYLRTSPWWTITLDFTLDFYYVLAKQWVWAGGLLLTILLNECPGLGFASSETLAYYSLAQASLLGPSNDA